MVTVAVYHIADILVAVLLKSFIAEKLPARYGVHHQNAQLITGIQKRRRRRVMRTANKVQPGILNFPGIAVLGVITQSITDVRVLLMAVGAYNIQFLTIQIKTTRFKAEGFDADFLNLLINYLIILNNLYF